jgi:hypothetical protein
MKQGTLITKLVMVIFFVGVVCYLGVAAWQSLSDPFTTVMAYGYTVDDGVEANGWLVREESVLPDGTDIMDIIPDEGEKLGTGQTVAVLYRDAAALERKQTIRSLELELDQLEYSLRQGDDAAEAGKLDEEIFTTMTTLHTAAATGDYSGLDDQALSLKSLVFRREYTHNGDAAAEIETLIASVTAQIGSLQTAATADTSNITVDKSGVYSGLVDGYESILTPAALDGLTVSGFAALTATAPTADENSVGKLITGSRWYLATLLSEEDAARLFEGGSVTVSFTRDFADAVPLRVEHISDPENGQAAVVLSSSFYLSKITLLRNQTVDLIFTRYTGIRVPKKALRVLEDGTAAVYAVAGATAELKKVTVLTEGEDFYLLAPAKGVAASRALRAGDEIVVSAKELYDGKVVR